MIVAVIVVVTALEDAEVQDTAAPSVTASYATAARRAAGPHRKVDAAVHRHAAAQTARSLHTPRRALILYEQRLLQRV